MNRQEPKCLFMLLARSTTVAKGLLSIHDVLTDVEIPHVPYEFDHPLEAVLFWTGPRGDSVPFVLRVAGPTGQAAENAATVEIGATGMGIVTVVFPAPLFVAFGEYRVEVLVGAAPMYSQTVWALPKPTK